MAASPASSSHGHALPPALSALLILAAIATTVGGGVVGGAMAFRSIYANRILPRVQIAGIPVGLLTPTRAEAALQPLQDAIQQRRVILSLAGSTRTWVVTSAAIGATRPITHAVEQAYGVGRHSTRSVVGWLVQASALLRPVSVALPIEANPTLLSSVVQGLAHAVYRAPVAARIAFDSARQRVVVVQPSQTGRSLDVAGTTALLRAALLGTQTAPSHLLVMPVHISAPQQSSTTAQHLAAALTTWLEGTLRVQVGGHTIPVHGAELAALVALQPNGHTRLNTAMAAALLGHLNALIFQSPRDAGFRLDTAQLPSLRPASDGQQITTSAALSLLATTVAQAGSTATPGIVTLPMQTSAPALTNALATSAVAALRAVVMAQRAQSTSPVGTVRTLAQAAFSTTMAALTQAHGRLTAQATASLQQAGALVAATVTLRSGAVHLTLPAGTLAAALHISSTPAGALAAMTIRPSTLRALAAPLLVRLSRPAQNATFGVDGTHAWVIPGKNGTIADMASLARALNTIRGASSISLPIPLRVVAPRVTTAALQALHITSAVGASSTTFYGSSTNRIINIETSVQHLDGTLLAPGQVFSFDQAIGDISLQTGYVMGIDIINNQDVPGIGGGVCQVAVTLFKGAIYTGLPIVERIPHANIVSYYQPVGMDATIYAAPGGPDVKFTNDTGHWLLFRFSLDTANNYLGVTFYGTPIGRQVGIAGPYLTYYKNGNVDAIFYRSITQQGKLYAHDSFFSHYVPVSN